MKKKDAQKFLRKMENIFNDDLEAMGAINILKERVTNLPEEDNSELFNLNPISFEFEIPTELKNVEDGYALFSDGACRGNPGPGAYALLIQNKLGEVVLKSSGVEMPTTNNKMEMQGVIRGLHGLFEKFQEDGMSGSHLPVFVYSDSKYVIDGITTWVPGWKNRGWKKADNKEPENLDLWKELDQLKSAFQHIEFIWVKGHAGHPQNEACDKMANMALNEAGF